jgi:hypothetical protein
LKLKALEVGRIALVELGLRCCFHGRVASSIRDGSPSATRGRGYILDFGGGGTAA